MSYLLGVMFGLWLMFSLVFTPVIFIQKVINKNWKFSKFEITVIIFGIIATVFLAIPNL